MQFAGYGGIILRQARVVGTAVYYAKCITAAVKVILHVFHHRMRRVPEVYIDQAANA